MSASLNFPRLLEHDASLEELRDYFADLMEWVPKQHVATLMEHGFSPMDIFALKRVGRAYRYGTENADTRKDLDRLVSKLQSLPLVI
ncbi:hypothetical protein [Leisingera caerulea]|uniref:Uncharacterized protein n=1 Tax=Leisingera caerulea TaxID=506591 RepID=A0A9Q9M1P1_LEICA|nr:hypothetical protein [Leisingera caerulea]UWQ52748.1 hypothetical protein K3721_12040 [Leisingera caerulea]